MDLKDLNKQQLILLTMLFSFVISIATGIVSISLMKVAPPIIPQTINKVIERTINNVVTAPQEVKNQNNESSGSVVGDGNVIVEIYSADITGNIPVDPLTGKEMVAPALGEGVIISDVGLVMVENSILENSKTYKIKLGDKFFPATVLKKFGNGFTILKINGEEKKTDLKPNETPALPASAATPSVDTQ